jgi:hypothetical protein
VREPPEPLYLWPENAECWTLFQAVQTQWRVGMGGREGLDYGGVRIVIGERRAWRTRSRRYFAEVCFLERVCLEEWAKRRP